MVEISSQCALVFKRLSYFPIFVGKRRRFMYWGKKCCNSTPPLLDQSLANVWFLFAIVFIRSCFWFNPAIIAFHSADLADVVRKIDRFWRRQNNFTLVSWTNVVVSKSNIWPDIKNFYYARIILKLSEGQISLFHARKMDKPVNIAKTFLFFMQSGFQNTTFGVILSSVLSTRRFFVK